MRRLLSLFCLLFPLPLLAQVPEWAKSATVRVTNINRGNSGEAGTGTLCHYDRESGKAYVITCRHVVPGSGLGRVHIETDAGLKKSAVYLGSGSTGSADVSILEIDGVGLPTFVPLADQVKQSQAVVQCGYGGGYRQERRGIVSGLHLSRLEGGYQDRSFALSFQVIPGDSGSGVFDAEKKKLVGVVWGLIGRPGVTAFSGPDECAEVLQACLKRRGRKSPDRCPGGSCSPGGSGGAPLGPIPDPSVSPKQPTTIDVKSLVAEVTKATQAELGPIKDGMGKLTDAASKLTEKVASLDTRIAAVEQYRAGQTAAAPLSACQCKDRSPELEMLQKELAQVNKRLEALCGSGTLHFKITPTPKK